MSDRPADSTIDRRRKQHEQSFFPTGLPAQYSTARARLRDFTPGGAAFKIWLPSSGKPVSHRWKRRRCGAHDSLLSQEQALSGHTKAKTSAYWMEHELRQYPRVELDLDALAAHARQLMPACGRDSQDQMTYQPNKLLAQRLGLDLVALPGGHLGFMASPAEFAKELMDALSR